MKLLFLDSQDFLSLGRTCFEKNGNPQEKIIIVGPNNVGKTNIARALKFAKEICQNSFREEFVSFINKDSDEKRFKLEIGFRLDEEERKDLDSFAEIYAKSMRVTANNIDNSDIKRIKKIKSSLDEEGIRRFLSKKLDKVAQELMQLISNKISSSASVVVQYVEGISPLIHVEFDINGNKTKLDTNDWICKNDVSGSISLKECFMGFLERKQEIKEIKVEELLDFILESTRLSLGGNIEVMPMKDEDRERISVILNKYNCPPLNSREKINLCYFLLYMFASRIMLLDEIRARPTEEIEEKKFRETMKNPSPYYDGTGKDLALFLFRLKNSQARADREKYKEIKKLFNERFNGLEFDISSSIKKEKSIKLDIWIMNGKDQVSADYAGSGLLEALNIFSVLVGNKNCVIVLDEPALHLHPTKQCELMELVNTRTKKESDNNQLIIITHSPYLIGVDSLEDVVRFDLEENKTKTYSFIDVLNQGNRDKIKKEFTLNPHYRNMLFARGVIIVEGESEEIGIPFLLRKMGLSLEEYDIEIFNAHSDTHFEMPTKIAEMLNIPYVIVCDKKALSKIPQESKHKVFNFEKDDFVDFLESEFSEVCNQIDELKTAKSKPQKTMMILPELKDEEIKRSPKIKELADFIRKNLKV